MWYKSNGGASSKDKQMLKTWARYLQSNLHFKDFQRLFFKKGVIRLKSDARSFHTEQYENIPVSFQNFTIKKELYEQMKLLTKQ